MVRLWNVYLPGRLFTFLALDVLLLTCLAALAVHPAYIHGLPDLTQTIRPVIVIGAVVLWSMYLFDLYDLDATVAWSDVFARSLRAVGLSVGVLALGWSWLGFAHIRFVDVEIALICFLGFFSAYRLFLQTVDRHFRTGERLLLVGGGPKMDILTDALSERASLPLRVSGLLADRLNTGRNVTIQHCGDLDSIDQVCRQMKPDRVAISADALGRSIPPAKLLALRRMGIRVEDASALYESLTGRVPVSHIEVRSLAFGKGFNRATPFSAFYRVVGVLASCVAMIVLSPVFLIIALAIKLDSRGPVFYRQLRVGHNGKLFDVVKFRSMRTDAEKAGPTWAARRDPRVTRMGRILRKLRLDELPQLMNVVRGEMCLVGPRPERPNFTEMLAEALPYYDLRHSVPPGITGWAQVCASYGASVEESRVKLEYDLFYLKNKSVLLDSMIVFRTLKICLFGRGAR